MTSLNLSGTLLDLSQPVIMGILNLTKDSFYDGGVHNERSAALKQVGKMIEEGADIIDIGAFSSRPGAQMVSPEEQLEILVPVVEAVKKQFPNQILSIDTWSSKVVHELAKLCPFIVNDISGFQYDKNIIAETAKAKLPYVLMHILGKPENMTNNAEYDDVCFEVLTYLAEKTHFLKSEGLKDIIIDPGFGFAKTRAHNFELLSKLDLFKVLDLPVMVGLSRKSMIYKTLGLTPNEALNGTTALHMTALMNGAKILRVHDVKEASETLTLWSQLHPSVN